MPSTTCEARNTTVLFKMVSNMAKYASMVTIHRRYFNEGTGMSLNVRPLFGLLKPVHSL